ncbi:acyltransferase [Chryseobacterium koreense]
MSIKGLIYRILNFRWNWWYEAYITYKYVDEYTLFPAIYIPKGIKLKITKEKSAKFIIKKKLILEKWKTENAYSTISLARNSELLIENDFIIGDGVKISVANKGTLILRGKKNDSGSGITANAVVLVKKHLEIGYDCIIAWDTFITDCDWHSIEGKSSQIDTILGDKVWLGVGAKILKGANIGSNSIITANSVVLKGDYPSKSLLSGSPAKIVQENVPQWHRDLK